MGKEIVKEVLEAEQRKKELGNTQVVYGENRKLNHEKRRK